MAEEVAILLPFLNKNLCSDAQLHHNTVCYNSEFTSTYKIICFFFPWEANLSTTLKPSSHSHARVPYPYAEIQQLDSSRGLSRRALLRPIHYFRSEYDMIMLISAGRVTLSLECIEIRLRKLDNYK